MTAHLQLNILLLLLLLMQRGDNGVVQYLEILKCHLNGVEPWVLAVVYRPVGCLKYVARGLGLCSGMFCAGSRKCRCRDCEC